MTTPRDALPYLEYTAKSGAKERIYADAITNVDFAFTSAITDHAVEDGSHPSDHIRPEPATGTVVLFFSETPTRGDLDDTLHGRAESIALPEYTYPELTPVLSPKGLTDLAGKGISAAAGLVGLGAAAKPTHYTALKFASAPGRGRTVLSKMLQLRADSALVTIGFTLARIPNLGLEEIAFAKKWEDGLDLYLSIKLKQVSFVTTKSAKAAPLPIEPRAQAKQDSVTVSLEDVPEGPKKTLTKGLVDKARGR